MGWKKQADKNCTNKTFRIHGACATNYAKGKHIQNEDPGTDARII